jgi:CRISPR-associated exonuclease Cas4
MTLPLALFLIFLSLFLLWQAGRQRQATGLPGGQIIYSDTRNWGAIEKPLYDRYLGLTGKPDYLVEQDGQIIPVEVKSSRVSESPFDSHIFQLAAYCMLVERTFEKRPTHGILHYPNRTYRIDYTQDLESALLDLLADMRADGRRKVIDRSHQEKIRCIRCGYRNTCDQNLK